MSAKKATEELLPEPVRPLKYRIPQEGPSPREYQLLEFQRTRDLTPAEAAELEGEQDDRTHWSAQWAEYREKRGAYEAQQRRMR